MSRVGSSDFSHEGYLQREDVRETMSQPKLTASRQVVAVSARSDSHLAVGRRFYTQHHPATTDQLARRVAGAAIQEPNSSIDPPRSSRSVDFRARPLPSSQVEYVESVYSYDGYSASSDTSTSSDFSLMRPARRLPSMSDDGEVDSHVLASLDLETRQEILTIRHEAEMSAQIAAGSRLPFSAMGTFYDASCLACQEVFSAILAPVVEGIHFPYDPESLLSRATAAVDFSDGQKGRLEALSNQRIEESYLPVTEELAEHIAAEYLVRMGCWPSSTRPGVVPTKRIAEALKDPMGGSVVDYIAMTKELLADMEKNREQSVSSVAIHRNVIRILILSVLGRSIFDCEAAAEREKQGILDTLRAIILEILQDSIPSEPYSQNPPMRPAAAFNAILSLQEKRVINEVDASALYNAMEVVYATTVEVWQAYRSHDPARLRRGLYQGSEDLPLIR